MVAFAHRNIPDSAGMNVFLADRGMLDLLKVYLSPDMLQLALPHLTRMGELVGGRLEADGAS